SHNEATPTPSTTAPSCRSWRSSSSRNCSMVRRQWPGAANRNNPSSTATRHSADSSSAVMPGSCRQADDSTVVAEVLQEVVVALQHDHALAVVECLAIGFKTALESVEGRILVGCPGVDLGSFRIALTAQTLGVTLGLGDDHRLLLVGARTHGLGLLGTLGAQAAGDLVTLGAHTPV